MRTASDPKRSLLALSVATASLLLTTNANGAPDERPRAAIAQYRVRLSDPMLRNSAAPTPTQPERERFRATQAAYVRSPFVLSAALRKPDVAALPLLEHQEDPIEWLADRLEACYPNDGELFEIRLAHPMAPADELKRIVNAVSTAYYEEVVFRERGARSRPVQILQAAQAKNEARLRDELAEYAGLAADMKENDLDFDESTAPELVLRSLKIETLKRLHAKLAETVLDLKIELDVPPSVVAIGADRAGAARAFLAHADAER